MAFSFLLIMKLELLSSLIILYKHIFISLYGSKPQSFSLSLPWFGCWVCFFLPIAPMSPCIFIWDYLLPVCPLHISNYITNIIVQIFWKQQTEYNYMVLHLHNIFLDKMDNDKRLQEFREFCSAQ